MTDVKEPSYAYSKVLPMSYREALTHVSEKMKKEGFGVLMSADLKATFKNKINEDIKPYSILGACNPKYAHHSIQIEKELGLLLPYNFIVYINDDDETVVAAVNPMASMQAVNNPALAETAAEVQAKIIAIMDSL